MKTYYPSVKKAKDWLAKADVRIEKARAQLADEIALKSELQRGLAEAETREAAGLPVDVLVEDDDSNP